MKTAVVIGGGLGGLFVGAMLSKEGLRVTVLEKNKTIGGGLQSFKRFGEVFDTGMHVVGGVGPGGNIMRICRYLGIADKAKFRAVDSECSDLLYFAEDRATYKLQNGKEGFAESLSRYFPDERSNIANYVKALFEIAGSIDLFNLRPSRLVPLVQSDLFIMSANDFIAKYLGDRKLRSVVAYINPFYGGRRDETPAYVHALISVLYIEGAYRFEGGSLHFAHLLESVITRAGGEVVSGDAVNWVEVSNKHVEYVRTCCGKRYEGDCYISAIHPCALFNIISPGAFPKSYIERLNSIPNAYSAFSLYIKLKENTFPYINHSEYYMARYDDIWECGDSRKPWPLGFLMMTPPEENQGAYSNKILITAPMLFDDVLRWENTTVGKRGEDYEQWKRERADQLLALVEELHPGINQLIEDVNTASPLTIRDFFGTKGGAISGFSRDCRNITLSQVPVVTKVRNLFLTGQNVNLHGFCGVPLTAISTCEAILGQNYIINRINAVS